MIASTTFSWNTHCLITQGALVGFPTLPLSETVSVVPVEEFVRIAGRAVQEVTQRVVEGVPTAVPDFRSSLRMNPRFTFSYVRCLNRHEIAPSLPHNPSRSGPPASSYRTVAENDHITVLDILATHSDEPDWGMDQNLFCVDDYGFGNPPFGTREGKSSQAAFHMAFFHEPWLLRLLAPTTRVSFLPDRFRLCCDLARVAQSYQIHYWMWRFRAWALHYLQDLTQPYHARALPFSLIRLLKAWFTTLSREQFSRRYKIYLMNRHSLFEATVHFLLNDEVKSENGGPLTTSLRQPALDFPPQPDDLVSWAKYAAQVAPKVNLAFERFLLDPTIDTTDYVTASRGARYPLKERIEAAKKERPACFQAFLDITAHCLSIAAEATRCLAKRW